MAKFAELFTQTEENNSQDTNMNVVKENTIEKTVLNKNDILDHNHINYECEETNVLELKNIVLKFGNFTLFNNLNFVIPDFKDKGQFITIMGKSGSGKTQLSRIISGLTKPTSGEVLLYNKPYTDKTFIPTVFQQYSSFDWMTVLENVALPMKMKGIDKKIREEKAMQVIEMVGLKGQENKWAKMPPLSGGQLQRVALARSLMTNSQIIVLDEYSSGLDIASKAAIQDILLKIFYDRQMDRTFLLITHDISEALYLSQRIYLMDDKTHSFTKVIDIDYGTDKRDRSLINTAKYNEYYEEIERFFKE